MASAELAQGLNLDGRQFSWAVSGDVTELQHEEGTVEGKEWGMGHRAGVLSYQSHDVFTKWSNEMK